MKPTLKGLSPESCVGLADALHNDAGHISIHDDAEFDALLQIVAQTRRLGVALVEKDYWVTHTLWALHAQGFDVWFKAAPRCRKALASSSGSRKTSTSSSSLDASPS